MADEIKDAKDGLKTRLETISGLKVYDHLPGSINEFPAAVIAFDGRDTVHTSELGLAGSSFVGFFTATVLIGKADDLEGSDELDKYCAPLGTESIEAASDGDTTWGSNVDVGRLLRVENVGKRKVLEGDYWAADFVFDFTKQVLT